MVSFIYIYNRTRVFMALFASFCTCVLYIYIHLIRLEKCSFFVRFDALRSPRFVLKCSLNGTQQGSDLTTILKPREEIRSSLSFHLLVRFRRFNSPHADRAEDAIMRRVLLY
jgi:hypothetical protein